MLQKATGNVLIFVRLFFLGHWTPGGNWPVSMVGLVLLSQGHNAYGLQLDSLGTLGASFNGETNYVSSWSSKSWLKWGLTDAGIDRRMCNSPHQGSELEGSVSLKWSSQLMFRGDKAPTEPGHPFHPPICSHWGLGCSIVIYCRIWVFK